MAEKIRLHDLMVLESGQTIDTEEIGIIANNGIRIFRSKKTPLYNRKGKIVGILSMSFEVTQEKRNEQMRIELLEQQSEQRVSTFSQNAYVLWRTLWPTSFERHCKLFMREPQE